MSRRKTKKQKQQVVKYESSNMSQEQMIEIQAEAYYRALKRIEDEKTEEDEQIKGTAYLCKIVNWHKKLLMVHGTKAVLGCAICFGIYG